MRDGLLDWIGMRNASEWMTDVEFCGFMEHIIKYVRPSKDSSVLLLVTIHRIYQ